MADTKHNRPKPSSFLAETRQIMFGMLMLTIAFIPFYFAADTFVNQIIDTERTELVEELERRAEMAEGIYNLNREQVEAIALALRLELKENEWWEFWTDIGIAFFFMLLGAFVGHYVERWMSGRRGAASSVEAL